MNLIRTKPPLLSQAKGYLLPYKQVRVDYSVGLTDLKVGVFIHHGIKL